MATEAVYICPPSLFDSSPDSYSPQITKGLTGPKPTIAFSITSHSAENIETKKGGLTTANPSRHVYFVRRNGICDIGAVLVGAYARARVRAAFLSCTGRTNQLGTRNTGACGFASPQLLPDVVFR